MDLERINEIVNPKVEEPVVHFVNDDITEGTKEKDVILEEIDEEKDPKAENDVFNVLLGDNANIRQNDFI